MRWPASRAGRLAADGGDQNLERAALPLSAEKSTQVLSLRKPRPGSAAGQQHRDDGKARLASLPVERQVLLPLLPGTEAFGAEEDGDGAAAAEGGFQRLRPRLAGRQIPAIEKDANAPVDQRPRDAFDRRMVAPVIAEEDVAGVLHRPVLQSG